MKRSSSLLKTRNLYSMTGFFSYVLLLLCAGPLVSCSDQEDDILAIQTKIPGTEIQSKMAAAPTSPSLIFSGLMGTSGSAIGPAGDLFVPEAALGQIRRINLKTGESTIFAEGLPTWLIGLGGVSDIEFIGETAYVIVTLVGSDLGGSDIVGIYRIDGPDSYTIIADIGAFVLANPPATNFFVPTGVQFAIQAYRGGFLVTDGHHNRVYYVSLDGDISIFRSFGNIVPTGLDIHGNTVYMAEAGATPHLPEDGKVISFTEKSTGVTEVASGAPLLVDVETGRGQTLFALAQGTWDQVGEGSPAEEDTGFLVKVNPDGTFTVIASELDRPTSLEIVGNTAYIINLEGEVWTVENISGPPYGI